MLYQRPWMLVVCATAMACKGDDAVDAEEGGASASASSSSSTAAEPSTSATSSADSEAEASTGSSETSVGPAEASDEGSEGEPVPPLFAEEGVWSLVTFDFGEGPSDVTVTRKDAFLLKFDAAVHVVTAAACTSEANAGVTPTDSPCRLTPDTTEWQCRCFAYAFEGEQMQWQEFEAGVAEPPELAFDPLATTGGSLTVIDVEAGGGSGDSYRFQPLPEQVFGSTNTSAFTFEQRATPLFDQVYMDREGRLAYCDPCVLGMP